MARFFIDRPVFAWVIAIFIMLAGILSLLTLPISQYPDIAPPQITVTTTYPGATAQTVEDSVTQIIEEEMNGATGMLYMESESQSNGSAKITLSFTNDTSVELASVDVQNRIKRIESRLPADVMKQGVITNKARSNYLAIVSLRSTDGRLTNFELGDYLARNVINDIKRLPGVGDLNLFGSEKAMRVWIDPIKLSGFYLTPADVSNAIRDQNAVVTSGTLAGKPNTGTEPITANIMVRGQLQTTEEFENIVLRANADGSTVKIKDVGRVELGAKQYDVSARLDGAPIGGFGIMPTADANTIATMQAVRDKMDELSQYFPSRVEYSIQNDTSKFVRVSIMEVVKTLFEGIFLVFLVMYLFLQNIRYTIIPTIVVPVALMGTFAVMKALGFSINMLTMFGLVLSIGILIDDAIVVVENVERIMAEEGLSPRDATFKAMGQITGAIIGITTVLMAVFVPMAFFGGAVGKIYMQFSLAMISAIAFSAFLALSLTPALCATILKPVEAGHHEKKTGFLAWFNRFFHRTTVQYERRVAKILGRSARYVVIYLAICLFCGLMYWKLPTSFLPDEDQGYLFTNIQLPGGASSARTDKVLEEVMQFYTAEPGVETSILVSGFSFSGNGQNGGLGFITLKDWDKRSANDSADEILKRAYARFSQIRDATVYPMNPPAIRELGNAAGFAFRLQDRGGMGNTALVEARDQLLAMASQSPILQRMRPVGMENTAQLDLHIDRDKAQALGVSFDAINTALSVALGSNYVNDFESFGRQQRVVVQSDSPKRKTPEDIAKIYARNKSGAMVPFSAFSSASWSKGPVQLIRYNGYPAIRIEGQPAPGMSTGDAMNEMERLARQLPKGFGFEWTGQSLEEKVSGSQAPMLFGLSILAVFLCLAALYESTTIPVAVMLVVPLGVIGALAGVLLRGMPNDVYFKVGLIATIGLSAKNAILIVEFAKDLQAQGKPLVRATLEAVRLRFRPIIMTSMAFILGVLPLVIARGAGAGAQQAIGTGVMGGMITATVLAVFLVPVFFLVVRSIFSDSKRQQKMYASNITQEGSQEVRKNPWQLPHVGGAPGGIATDLPGRTDDKEGESP
ncbi:MAG: efflux RND transporter permease subunit [Burkholderiaceae bacterium]|jgi:multidrug efflux pump|nr:efflux RND transporter permease subunit [Burkholderiaceae bacterium]